MDVRMLAQVLKKCGEPAFRLAQVKRAFYKELLFSWDELSVFGKALRTACADAVSWDALSVVQTVDDKSGESTKILFSCVSDNASIESVIMRHEDGRRTVCISSQVGCPMKCAFCATGKLGWTRNLSENEIAEQVIQAARILSREGARVTNVVIMGMGEPLHNYDAVLSALHILNDSDGFGLGARHMSLSTCGIVPGILRLAKENLQINLAVSLHAATDELRDRIMPVNKAFPLAELLASVRLYQSATNRRVMMEYLLLDNINDHEDDAQDLARLLGPDYRLMHVNVLTYHPTGSGFKSSSRERAESFIRALHDRGVPATHRRTFGEGITAACGQLSGKKKINK